MRWIWILCLALLHLGAFDSTIEIVKQIDKAPKIVVADASGMVDQRLNRKFLKLLIGDLKVSAHFNVDENYIKIPYDDDSQSAALAKSGDELLAKVKLERQGGKLLVSVKLINLKNATTLYEKFYSISRPKRYPFLAHNAAIDINKYVGAPSIAWMRKYIIFAKYTASGKSNIVVSDYTLSFQKTIVRGGLNVFPKWADEKQSSFYYTSYNGYQPTLYKVNIFTGRKRKIASSPGMIVCSDISENGDKLLLTMAPKDQPDIYLYDLRTGSKRRLTRYHGIDVGGQFVDHDKRFVFISDRLGYPNVFSKAIRGGGVEQMIYHGKNNSSCTSFGKYIVYSSREGKSALGDFIFNLYLISTQTDFIRKLTTNGKNMFPRFGEDADTVLFIKYVGNDSSLGVLRLNENRSFLFPLRVGKIQSIDW